jgi:hypothetical protein
MTPRPAASPHPSRSHPCPWTLARDDARFSRIPQPPYEPFSARPGAFCHSLDTYANWNFVRHEPSAAAAIRGAHNAVLLRTRQPSPPRAIPCFCVQIRFISPSPRSPSPPLPAPTLRCRGYYPRWLLQPYPLRPRRDAAPRPAVSQVPVATDRNCRCFARARN